MMTIPNLCLELTDAAVTKIIDIVHDEKNPNLKLRVYIVGGGCGGFQYRFLLDDNVQSDDILIERNGASLVIDSISFQYLMGGIIDYYEGLEGSRFTVVNPNAVSTCSCGSSFSV